jgi:hypothetical protein
MYPIRSLGTSGEQNFSHAKAQRREDYGALGEPSEDFSHEGTKNTKMDCLAVTVTISTIDSSLWPAALSIRYVSFGAQIHFAL